eukprot:1160786-Pelagomonas_calceolata.AAC.1
MSLNKARQISDWTRRMVPCFDLVNMNLVQFILFWESNPKTNKPTTNLKGAVLYWHFVDIVWIAVYGIIYAAQLNACLEDMNIYLCYNSKGIPISPDIPLSSN